MTFTWRRRAIPSRPSLACRARAPWPIRTPRRGHYGGTAAGISTLTVNRVGVNLATIANGQLAIGYAKGTDFGVIVQPAGTDVGAGAALLFNNVATLVVGSINTSATATTYNTTSDARLKDDVQPLVGGLDVIRALNPVAFRWRSDDSHGRGLLAHEVQEVIPDGVITGARDAVDDEGNVQPQMIDYSKLVPYLIGAVKELTQQVEMLQAQLAAAGV